MVLLLRRAVQPLTRPSPKKMNAARAVRKAREAAVREKRLRLLAVSRAKREAEAAAEAAAQAARQAARAAAQAARAARAVVKKKVRG